MMFTREAFYVCSITLSRKANIKLYTQCGDFRTQLQIL